MMKLNTFKTIILGSLLILVIGFSCEQYLERIAKNQSTNKLALFLSLRHAALSDVFASIAAEVKSASHNHILPSATHNMSEVWSRLSAKEKQNLPNTLKQAKSQERMSDPVKAYLVAHQTFEDYAKKFIKHFGYYDIFLISPAGDVVYSYAKEADFGSNLKEGPFADTALADVYTQAQKHDVTKEMIISDYKRYQPSGNVPAMFCAHPVMKDGKVVGVMALQMPTELINQTMKFSAGMGKSGETYLVGSDYLMRSQSRFIKEDTVLKIKVETMVVNKGLKDQSGQLVVKDYRGTPVFSAYTPFKFGQQQWVMLAEKDVAEVVSPIRTWWITAVLIALASFWLLVLVIQKLGVATKRKNTL